MKSQKTRAMRSNAIYKSRYCGKQLGGLQQTPKIIQKLMFCSNILKKRPVFEGTGSNPVGRAYKFDVFCYHGDVEAQELFQFGSVPKDEGGQVRFVVYVYSAWFTKIRQNIAKGGTVCQIYHVSVILYSPVDRSTTTNLEPSLNS